MRSSRPGARAGFMVFAGLAALLQAMPAAAQEAGEAQADEGPRRLNAVTVEATRRQGVTVQDVPVAVTAFDADLLDETGVARLNDLEQVAPSIQVTQTESAASGTNIAIRGIGTGANNPGFEPAVGVLIDGVYRTRTGVALSELPELASVEVLRGPQGTLFGRNTSAGVVSIRTAAPEFEPRAALEIGAGNYDMLRSAGMVTGGFSDQVAGRLDYSFRSRDGYVEDVNTDREFQDLDRYVVRGQLLYQGGESELRLIADVAGTDEACCAALNFNPGPAGPAVNAGAALAGLVGIYPGPPSDDRVAITPARGFGEEIEEWGVSAEFETAFAGMDFTSITSWRDWEAVRDQDVDFSGIDRAYRDGTTIGDRVFTQELRLQDEAGPLDWLVGAYYLNEEISYFDTIRFGTQGNLLTDLIASGAAGGQLFGTLDPTGTVVPSLLGNIDPLTGARVAPGTPGSVPIFIPRNPEGSGQADDFTVDTEAFAIFTHNEVSLSNKATLTLGGRLNTETKEVSYDLDGDVPSCAFLLEQPGVAQALGTLSLLVCNPAVNTEYNGTGRDSFDETAFTGTAKLAYAFTPDRLGYVSYARGYKSGGYNLDRSGFDSVLFGGDGAQPDDLRFDSEFVDSYEIGLKTGYDTWDATLNGALFYQEVSDFQQNFFTGTNFRTINADVETYGLELDASARPVDGLTLQGGYAWTIAEFVEDVTAPRGDGTVQVLTEGGRQITNVPEHVLTGAGTYRTRLSDALEGVFHVNMRFNSETALSDRSRGRTDNDAYALFGARFAIADAGGVWEAAIFGENIFDEEYNISALGVPEQTGTNAVYPGLPAMYGVELKLNFGG